MKKYYERYWDNRKSLDTDIKWSIIEENIPLGNNIRFLDFGCGSGTLLSKIVKVNSQLEVHGADVSKQAITIIKKKIPKGKFYHIQDGKKLPFKKNSFDFILASDVLEHIYDTEFIFQELYRVLKPNGKLLITVPYHGMVKNIVITFLGFDEYFEPKQPHIRFYTKNNLFTCITNNKLKVIKYGYYGRFYPVSNGIYTLCVKSNIAG